MPVRFALNGVGRIGRAVIRIATQRSDLELVAINDLANPRQLAALLGRDSIHGSFAGEVTADERAVVINGRRIAAFSQPEPARIPWLELEPEIVLDATGRCKTRDAASHHCRGSVRKVVVSANAEGLDLTICMGVNSAAYDPQRHHLLSGASCTTNCLVPVVSVLQREFGFKSGLFNTVHSYNNDQRLLSYPHADPRRAREGALNMIPTTTSASHAAHRILPGLEGKLTGFAVRVPTPNVSLVDLVAALQAEPSIDAVNQAFARAAASDLAGILTVTDEELVSSDFVGNPHSAIIDLPLTQRVDGGLYRLVAWYDNEWGHASRLTDLLELAGRDLDASANPPGATQ